MKYIVAVLCIVFAISYSYAESIEVPNFSFENSPTAKTWNWNDQEGTGVDVIEDWNLDYSGSTSDSGVEDNSSWPSSTGTWHAFLYGPYGPGGAWQELDEAITENTVYQLTIDARWSDNTANFILNYHDDTNRIELASESYDLTDDYVGYTVTFFAQPGAAYIGKNIGIEFDNLGSGWASYDNVRLDKVTSYVNQPTNVSPGNNETNVSVNPILIGSAFDGNSTHEATQWQIWGDESRIDNVWDSGEDTANLVTVTVSAVTLNEGEYYFWRIRYKDNNDLWSTWSDMTRFTTEDELPYFRLSEDLPLKPGMTEVYTGTKDAELIAWEKSNNNGGFTRMRIGANSVNEPDVDEKRAVLAFSGLGSYLPYEEWEITNAWIEINLDGANDVAKTYQLFSITNELANWNEGNGDGWDGEPAQQGEVCWDYARYDDINLFWNGAHETGFVSHVPEGPGVSISNQYGWHQFQLSLETVRLWQTNDAAAARGVLIANVPYLATNYAKSFVTRNSALTNRRPRLCIAAYSVIAVEQPYNVSPPTATKLDTLSPTLIGSAFVPVLAGTHVASQWQISTNQSFTSIIWDSGEDSANLITNTLALGILQDSQGYYWRVRYKHSSDRWSVYSEPTWFITPGPTPEGKIIVLQEGLHVSDFPPLSYTGTKDNHIFMYQPNNNAGQNSELPLCSGAPGGGDDKRILLAFPEVGTYVPDDEWVITNAWLELYFSSISWEGAQNIKLVNAYPVVSGTWNEGLGTGWDGELAEAGESCWNYPRYDQSTAWNGGNDGDMIDYTAAGPDVPLSNNFGWQKFQLDLSVVQGWQANDAAAARGVLIANVPLSTNQGVKVFLSSDHGDTTRRPKLMIATEFIPEPAGGMVLLVLALLGCTRRR